jgi:hypothetical protein
MEQKWCAAYTICQQQALLSFKTAQIDEHTREEIALPLILLISWNKSFQITRKPANVCAGEQAIHLMQSFFYLRPETFIVVRIKRKVYSCSTRLQKKIKWYLTVITLKCNSDSWCFYNLLEICYLWPMCHRMLIGTQLLLFNETHAPPLVFRV